MEWVISPHAPPPEALRPQTTPPRGEGWKCFGPFPLPVLPESGFSVTHWELRGAGLIIELMGAELCHGWDLLGHRQTTRCFGEPAWILSMGWCAGSGPQDWE